MKDIDNDPLGEHKSRPEEPTGESNPLTLVGRSTWEPEHEQEPTFGGGRIQAGRITDSFVDSLYKELSKHYSQNSDATHYDNFRHEGNWLYF